MKIKRSAVGFTPQKPLQKAYEQELQKMHRSQAVRTWLHSRRDRIEVFFLPAYSQELNPIRKS